MPKKKKELTLSTYLGAFIALGAGDSHRFPSNLNFLMMFLFGKWGRMGENAPDFLKDHLSRIFISTDSLKWSDTIHQIIANMTLCGELTPDPETPNYWVKYTFDEMYKDRFEPVELEYLKALASEYIRYARPNIPDLILITEE